MTHLPQPEIRLRDATPEDADCLLLWRNDAKTRAASFQDKMVSQAEHRDWLKNSLVDSDRLILIAELDRRAVGMLRFDKLTNYTALISILIAPQDQNKGFARTVLSLGVKMRPFGCQNFTAEIKPDNIQSQRLFQNAGFQQTQRHEGRLIYDYKEKNMSDKTKYDLIIDDIEAVRTRNNKNWMDILRLAFRHSPQEAAAILREIYKEDKEISDLAARLTDD